MKVTEDIKTSFVPIVITIESVEELRELQRTLNTGCGSEKLWSALESIISERGLSEF